MSLKRVITDASEIGSVMDHFNRFHDSFIKSIKITTPDEFQEREGLERSAEGRLDSEILFAHPNYPAAGSKADRYVRVLLHEIDGLILDLRRGEGEFSDWNVEQLTIESIKGSSRFRLAAQLSFMTASRQWEKRKSLRMDFAMAEFFEEDGLGKATS